MNAKRYGFALAVLAGPLAAQSPGPIRLLSCIVSDAGLLEVAVENVSDAVHTCNLRCDYVISGYTLSHPFEQVTIPSRFKGIVGQVDTSRGQPGSYSGYVAACEKLPST